jgi:hypothetical protein
MRTLCHNSHLIHYINQHIAVHVLPPRLARSHTHWHEMEVSAQLHALDAAPRPPPPPNRHHTHLLVMDIIVILILITVLSHN